VNATASIRPSPGTGTTALATGQVAVLAVLAMLGVPASPGLLRVAPGCSGRSPAVRSLRRSAFHAGDGRTDAFGEGLLRPSGWESPPSPRGAGA
jgi:hypothetical protein